MKTLRTLTALFFVAALTSNLARAQVATPNLTPVAGAVTGNAATLAFAPQSFIGGSVGQGDARVYNSALGADVARGDLDSKSVHLRLVGDTFAFAAEGTRNEFTLEPEAGQVFTFHVDEDLVRGALAVGIGDSLSIGVGTERAKRNGTSQALLNLPPPTVLDSIQTDVVTLSHAGVVLRFGTAVFLGAMVGRETFEFDQQATFGPPISASGAQTFEVSRDVRRAGAGILWIGNGGNAVRLELAAESRDGYDEPDAFGGASRFTDEREGTRGELELRWGSLSLAAFSGSNEVREDGQVTQETDSSGVAVGWVPEAGWALTVAAVKDETHIMQPFDGLTTFESTVVGLHWMF